MRKQIAAAVAGTALALAAVGGAAAAEPFTYVDRDDAVELRTDPRTGHFTILTPSGYCSGRSPALKGRRREPVISGGEGCAAEFTHDGRHARGWVQLPAEQFHFDGPYVRYSFDAVERDYLVRAPVYRSFGTGRSLGAGRRGW